MMHPIARGAASFVKVAAEISKRLVPLNLLVSTYVGSADMTNNPVVLNVTNHVVQTQTANALLAIGASPIMSFEPLEIPDILRFTHAINLNIGTLTQDQFHLFNETAKQANQLDIPIALDPVGAGATALRTKIATDLLMSHQIKILKGNAAEISALHHHIEANNTIDSCMTSSDVLDAAKTLSHQYQTTVIVSGEIDYIVNKESIDSIKGGTPLMRQVTGMGCIATALCSAYLAKETNASAAGYHAMTMMKKAAEKAVNHSAGPGSFLAYFIDSLYELTQS